MTDPEGTVEAYQHAVDVPAETGPPQVDPIPVSGAVAVVGPVYTRDAPPAFGAWSTTAFAGTPADRPVPILPDDPHRRRAVIIVTGAAPAVLWLGTEAQANAIAGANGAGGIALPAGQSITVTNRQPVWAMSDLTHAVSALVLNERDG